MKKGILALIFSALLIGLDQLTKYLASTRLGEPLVLIDGVFELRYTQNRGAAFGILQNAQVFFIIITVIVLALLVFIFFRIPAEKRYMPLLVLVVIIFSGAAGNLIDRIANGFVVDFMYISLIDFPVFNVADLYVSWGAVALGIFILFKYRDEDFRRIFRHER